VDLDRCRETGVAVVRRITGGRAVYHRREVTYSVAASVPHPAFPSTIRGAYEAIARALEAALVDLGFRPARRDRDAERVRHGAGSPLCFAATFRNELAIDGKKVVGSAQRRWPTGFLQHGSILLHDDSLEASRVFPAAPSMAESVAALGTYRPTITSDDVYGALVTNWERLFGVTLCPGGLTADEAAVVAESSRARDLAVTQPV
jgi:lipoate-protein ligase A